MAAAQRIRERSRVELRLTVKRHEVPRLNSQWAEILTYRNELATSLRLYFDPIHFLPALGPAGRWLGPAAARLTRRGLARMVAHRQSLVAAPEE